MDETLKMMQSILVGKEDVKVEKELIQEYKEKLSPNILAYFFVHNFGLIHKTSEKYSILCTEDKASFCLQELDNCLQSYSFNSEASFITYFIRCYKNRLYKETKSLNCVKRKTLNNYEQLDSLIDIGNYDYINDYDLILNEYSLTNDEKKQCKLLLAGYTVKEIAKLFKISSSAISQKNSKIKQKILNFT